jgi:hypothetical protein
MKTLPILKNIKQLHKLENLGVVIEFDPQEEDISPSDNLEFEEDVKNVVGRYNSGNRAAWFCAKVTVKYRGLEEDDYLGCCSYKSFKDFTSEFKGYYLDMINTCVARINSDIELANGETIKQWTIRKAKNLISEYGLYIVHSNQLQTL